MDQIKDWIKEKVNFDEIGDHNRIRRAFDSGGKMVHGVVGLDEYQ